MKKVSLLIIAFLCFSTSFAQSFQDEFDLIQSIYGMDKRDIVEDFIELNDTQESEFWILYDQYEIKRKELGEKKFSALLKYVDDYGAIHPNDAEMIMKEGIPLRKQSDKLIDSYYKKIKKKTDPVVALQFYQIERYHSDLIRIEMLEEIYTTKN